MSDRGQRIFSSPLVPALVAAVALAAYRATLSPGVTFIDSGELATVAARLGVAHPTGYPLFTLVGSLWCRMPAGGEEIVRLNFMAAVLCAAAAGFFCATAAILFRSAARMPSEGSSSPTLRPWVAAAAAAGAALMLAFSETYWSQATSIEVYSLHLFLLSGTMLAFTIASRRQPRTEKSEFGWWALSAFLLGLGFTNHMTTILLLPGLLFLFFRIHGTWKRSASIIGRTLPAFLLGLTPYLYLPLRASQDPVPNWGNPATLERLLWHVSGKQYRVWIFSSPDVAVRQLRAFIDAFPGEFGWPALLLVLAGAVTLFRAERRLFWTSIILFVTCVLYAINYDIHDIESYFLLAYWVTALWIGYGLLAAGMWLVRVAGKGAPAIPALLLVPALLLFASNFRALDSSRDHAVEDYTRNMFESLDSNAVVLSFQWDYWVSASYYHQLVRGVRRDVTVIDKELLRRSWYVREVRMRFPRILERVNNEVDGFLVELDKFEHDRPYNAAVIQARFEAMINAIFRKNGGEHPLYVTGEIEPEFTRGFQRVPAGLAFRLFADSLRHDSPVPEFAFRTIEKGSKMHNFVKRLYADAALAWGQYAYGTSKRQEFLEKAAKLALRYDPSYSPPGELLRRLGR